MKNAAFTLMMMMGMVLSAQKQTGDSLGNFYWVDANIQVGGALVGDVALNVNHGDWLATIEYQEMAQDIWLGPPTTLNSVNIMPGMIFKSGLSYMALSGGLGIGTYREPYESGREEGLFWSHPVYGHHKKTVVSLPLQVKAGIAAKVISLQMKAGVNLNQEMAVFHIGLGVGFGKFF